MANSLNRYGYTRLEAADDAFGRCPKTRKVAHPSRSRAKRHAKQMKRRGGCVGELSVYECRSCGAWHVGRRRG